MRTGYALLREDRLVSVWRSRAGKVVRKGKRVSRTCPLTHEERRVYVEKGPTACAKALVDGRKLHFTDAFKLLAYATRGRW